MKAIDNMHAEVGNNELQLALDNLGKDLSGPTMLIKKESRKETERNPPGFDFGSLDPEQRTLHDKIIEGWGSACVQHAALGRKLVAMKETFKSNGSVRNGGRGSKWERYLSAIGIPKSTARDYMKLAKKRIDAGIPEDAENHLVRVGIPLDKPKVVDALLTPELRQEVIAINSTKAAETLKPRIIELSQTTARKSKSNNNLIEQNTAPLRDEEDLKSRVCKALRRYLDGAKTLDECERRVNTVLERQFPDYEVIVTIRAYSDFLEVA